MQNLSALVMDLRTELDQRITVPMKALLESVHRAGHKNILVIQRASSMMLQLHRDAYMLTTIESSQQNSQWSGDEVFYYHNVPLYDT